MNDIKLESCPVCGSDPVFTENFSEEIKLAVRCEHCSLVFPLVFGVDEWNESIIYQRGKTIASEIIKTVELGDLCAVHISSSNVELAMQVHTALHANQGVPEVMIFIGDDLELMDEDRMRECGWVKKENILSLISRLRDVERQLACYLPPQPEPEYACHACSDKLCGGTKIYDGRKCDGIPF